MIHESGSTPLNRWVGGGRTRELLAKGGLVRVGSPSSGGHRGSIRWLTSLVLTRQFQTGWSKIPVLGEAATVMKLGIKSRFGDVGLSTSDSILGLLSLFNTANSAQVSTAEQIF